MSTNTILLSVLFGSFGTGYMMYGKSQQKVVAFFAGLGLCVVPYFMANVYLLLAVGSSLLAAPFKFRD